MTCSTNNGDATKWVTSFAKKHYIEISYSNSIKMIGNHILIVDIEKEKCLDKNIEENINQLIQDISNNRKYINNGIIIRAVLRNALKVVNKVHPMDSPDNFSVNEDCIKCSTYIKI